MGNAASCRRPRQGSSVARLRSADREAAEELFNACYPRLAGWVRRLVDDDETAHEIASEAFTRLLSRWTAPGQPAELPVHDRDQPGHGTTGARQAGNAARSGAMTAAAPAEPAYQPGPGRRRPGADRGLPAKLRSAFLLHYYAGFGVKEVAAMLGRPEGTIKADLHHARARLKAAIGDAGD